MDRLEDAPQIRVLMRYFPSEEVPYEQAYVPLQVSHLPLLDSSRRSCNARAGANLYERTVVGRC